MCAALPIKTVAAIRNIASLDRIRPLKQPDNHTCGPTSAVMVLGLYGKDVGLETMTRAARTSYFDVKIPGTATKMFTFKKSDWGYTNPNHLRDALNRYVRVSKKENASVQDIARAIQQNKPVIVLVRNGMKSFHYFIIVGYVTNVTNNEKRVTHWRIVDTNGSSPELISHKDFKKSWDFKPVDYKNGHEEYFKCTTCKGDGSHWTKCVTCSGTGKWSAFGGWTKCVACSGSGKWSAKCPICQGDGEIHDFILDAVKLAGVKKRTIIVPDSPPTFSTSQSPTQKPPKPSSNSGGNLNSSSQTGGSSSGTLSGSGGTRWSNVGIINGVQIYRDNTTGLQWTVSLPRAENLRLAHHQVATLGFRIPTHAEFRSLEKNGGIRQLGIDTRLNTGFYWEASGGKVNGNGGNFATLFPANHLTIGAPYAIGVK